jgi:hypothetical protein
MTKMNHIRILFALSLVWKRSLAVTVIPSKLHLPKPFKFGNAVSSEYKLLVETIPSLASHSRESRPEYQGLFGSLAPMDRSNIYPLQDSFIRGAIDAWVQHQHFVIRPDDVWFTILMQLNFYLRSHQDSKEVRDKIDYRNYMDVGFMSWFDVGAISDRVIATEIKFSMKSNFPLYSFIQPNFTTSTVDDKSTASLITIGYTNTTSQGLSTSLCGGGLPSATLRGTEKDWQRLLHKLDFMPELGGQVAEYSKVLRPILSRFVKSFTQSDDINTRHFWENMVSSSEGECSETGVIAGWLSGFQYWTQSGALISRGNNKGSKGVTLDGVEYSSRNINELPSAYAGLHLRSYRGPDCVMDMNEILAGMIGKKVTKGKPANYTTALQKANLVLPAEVTEDQHATLQSFSRWIQFFDERYPPPPKLPGEDERSYTQRTCKGRPEGTTPSHNWPQDSLDRW